MFQLTNIRVQKSLIAWILTNAYGRHNTTWYPKEVNQLCIYATMLLSRPEELMRLINYSGMNEQVDSLENKTLKYVDNCLRDVADPESEFYEWEFEYSDEFNQAYERRRFDKRPHFFAENMVSNEIIAYGV